MTIIKRYNTFINENSNYNIGEWVESVIDDKYIKNIVNRFIEDIDPSIRLANAINLLNDKEKADIKMQISNYLENGIEEKEPVVTTSTEINESGQATQQVQQEISLLGKGTFNSYLKAITALGGKDVKANYEKCPNDFLIFFFYENISTDRTRYVFNRFKSLQSYIDKIDYGRNEMDLYYGIKCDGTFEYGISYDSKLSPIGRFKLSKSAIKWIISLESKSIQNLKKDIVNLTFNDVVLFGKIKSEMSTYKPGFFEKNSTPFINDKIISFGYYGLGKWENGKLTNDQFNIIKNNFNNYILSKKWSNKVLFSITSKSYWVFFNIKIK